MFASGSAVLDASGALSHDARLELEETKALNAFVLLVICRRALHAVSFGLDIDDELWDCLDDDYRGYLQPGAGGRHETPTAQGFRRLVDLLADLEAPIRKAMEEDAPEGGPGPAAQHPTRLQAKLVALFLGIGTDPMSRGDAARFADTGPRTVRDESSFRKAFRKELPAALSRVYRDFPSRPLDRRLPLPARSVGTMGFWPLVDELTALSTNPDGTPIFRALGVPATRTALLLSAIQLAQARFDGVHLVDALGNQPDTERNPIAAWVEVHIEALNAALDCEQCPGSDSCPCKLRTRLAPRRPGPNASARSRDAAEAGQAALEVTATWLARRPPHEWPSMTELRWVIARHVDPTVTRETPAAVRGLHAFGGLLEPRTLTPDELVEAAAALDETQDTEQLEVMVRIALRRLLELERLQPDDRASLAALGRSIAGALRHLRSARLGSVQLILGSSGLSGQPKLLEGWQEVPLAEQRRGQWHRARWAYEFALLQLAHAPAPQGAAAHEWQKRWEVTQQLHLGRLGGLTLQAEELLFDPQPGAEAIAQARRLAETGRALSGDAPAGALTSALQTVKDIADRGGSADAPESLRYHARWALMPMIMRARITVALAAAHRSDDRRKVEQFVGEASTLLAAVDASPVATPRHRWESQRVQLVAALVLDDAGMARATASEVVARGGDDGNDYAVLAAKWAAADRRSRTPTSTAVYQDIAQALVTERALPPRLPDLSTIRRAET